MSQSLMDPEIKNHISEIKQLLSQLPTESNSLEVHLEYAAKHIKPYLHIIKTHIHQLEEVLKSENHNYKTLESINLSDQVKKLMSILENLEEKNVQYFEDLSSQYQHF